MPVGSRYGGKYPTVRPKYGYGYGYGQRKPGGLRGLLGKLFGSGGTQ